MRHESKLCLFVVYSIQSSFAMTESRKLVGEQNEMDFLLLPAIHDTKESDFLLPLKALNYCVRASFQRKKEK